MKRRYILIIWSIILTLLPLLNGCIREEEFDNTPQGNFEALWEIIDEQYCFLDYKQIDWMPSMTSTSHSLPGNEQRRSI